MARFTILCLALIAGTAAAVQLKVQKPAPAFEKATAVVPDGSGDYEFKDISLARRLVSSEPRVAILQSPYATCRARVLTPT